MKNAIILHGMPGKDEYYDSKYPSASNSHWVPWLQKQLLIQGIPTATPEMPLAFEPDYSIWQREFERFDITPETILVGHSCGGGFIVRWLSEHPDVRVGRVVLVAPWIDVDHELGRANTFFKFRIDSRLVSRTASITILRSDNDAKTVLYSIERLETEIANIKRLDFHNYGHFTFGDLETEAFPELLAQLLD